MFWGAYSAPSWTSLGVLGKPTYLMRARGRYAWARVPGKGRRSVAGRGRVAQRPGWRRATRLRALTRVRARRNLPVEVGLVPVESGRGPSRRECRGRAYAR